MIKTRCEQGIAAAEQLLRNGHPEVDGLTMALKDWRTEARLIEREEYQGFLRQKQFSVASAGFSVDQVNPMLFQFQSDITKWALKKGKAALFEDCGLGKTPQQLEWAQNVYRQTGKPVIIFAPLAVSRQTQREGEKFNIPVTICRQQADISAGVNIANYEMLKYFDARAFGGLVIDESSILKGDGPMRRDITAFAHHVPYRLAATATPAPNDHMELGNHAEFLGIMSKSEMLSTFFVHDGENTSKWRLKGHAESAFWKWVASWAVMIRKPSDLGYDDGAFKLPPIEYHQHTVGAEWSSDYLFPVEARTLRERQAARRDSMEARIKLCAELVNQSNERWISWVNLNPESRALAAAIDRGVEITGSQKTEVKELALLDFAEGRINRAVTKGKIAGWGLNLQECSHMTVFPTDSWEMFYQIVRRCYRYGQTQTVHVHIITSELEAATVRNIERKERDSDKMAASMLGHMREVNTAEIHGTIREHESYNANKKVETPSWL